MAALLAHTRALDLAVERPTHGEGMAERRRLGLTAVGYDNGREQMAAAEGMNIGYVAVDAVRPSFVIYRSRLGPVPEDPICKYAVIRVGLMGGGHSEPFPTRGETRCGLVTRAEACRMLEQRGYSNTTLARRVQFEVIC